MDLEAILMLVHTTLESPFSMKGKYPPILLYLLKREELASPCILLYQPQILCVGGVGLVEVHCTNFLLIDMPQILKFLWVYVFLASPG